MHITLSVAFLVALWFYSFRKPKPKIASLFTLLLFSETTNSAPQIHHALKQFGESSEGLVAVLKTDSLDTQMIALVLLFFLLLLMFFLRNSKSPILMSFLTLVALGLLDIGWPEGYEAIAVKFIGGITEGIQNFIKAGLSSIDM